MSDLAAGLAAHLGTALGEPATVDAVQPLSAGARRRNIAVDATVGGRRLALVATLVPAGIQLLPVTAEAAVRELARAAGVAVPELVSVCPDPAVAGEPFLLSARIEGETVPRRVLRLVEAERTGERVAEQLGTAMARLHAVDPALAPAELPGTAGENPAAAALAEAEQGVAALLADRPTFVFALRRLARDVPAPPPRPALIHTDLRNGNLIIGPDGIRAVLDWEGAQRFGDPMRDAAWAALRMWRFGADDREFGGFAGRAPFVRGYTEAGGDFDPDRFRWWKTLATLAWGIGLAGQAAAHLDGSVRDIVMAASGRRIPEIEWDLLMQTRPS